jgi:hypothetical protein
MSLPFYEQHHFKKKRTFIFVLFLILAKTSVTNKKILNSQLLLEAASEFAILIKDANITNLRIFGPTNVSSLDDDLADIYEFMERKSSSKQVSNVLLR